MELTTCAILRRITETPLSTAAHKLATIILDGIAWKDGYNGLERGTAAFTLAHLAEKMRVSRQHLTALLVELAASGLALVRWKPNGKFAPWLFRFGGQEEAGAPPDVVSASGDKSLSRENKNKTIFAGRIEIEAGTNVYQTPWADLIKAAKASLACWNVDTQVIWERFLAFNRARGNTAVPAGFLLGFMRRWRTSVGADVPIIEIAFTARAAFFLRADQQSAGALFFDTIGPEEPARVREVVLGTPQAGTLPEGVWMAPLSGGRELLAVHAGSYSGFVLHDNPAMSDKTWPMTRVQLRGGEPRRIAVLDRSFRETSPGGFTGTALLPAVGTGWELVLTTGLGGQTVCFDVPTRAEVAAADKGPGLILAERDGGAVRLALVGPDGVPSRMTSVRLIFSAPQANWRRSAVVRTDADGRVTSLFRLPDTRPVIVTAVADGGRAFLPLALED